MAEWFGSSWPSIAFVVAGTGAMYVSTLIGIRIAGRRTVSQMSAFDFVVTVAIGTLVANTGLVRRPSVTQGIAALVTLLVLQFVVGSIRRRSVRARRIIDLPPLVLVAGGRLREHALGPPQMTRQDVLERLRQAGVYRVEDVSIAILESTGGFSVSTDPSVFGTDAIDVLPGGGPARGGGEG